eukprot:TRINITY_DN1612_c1_g1_i1.p1 TRINITY_DN1612_c1_g1~~TRINITY_DN1612_c1_g1_i1.p1  ORF type:complete len:404 (-),score=169.91 TRINITY_DN1612_c1_g1_i1:292-1503(-)
MEAAQTRNRANARHGPSAVFSGRVRKWQKKWSKRTVTDRLAMYKWVPAGDMPSAGGKGLEAGIERPFKFLPVSELIKRIQESGDAQPSALPSSATEAEVPRADDMKPAQVTTPPETDANAAPSMIALVPLPITEQTHTGTEEGGRRSTGEGGEGGSEGGGEGSGRRGEATGSKEDTGMVVAIAGEGVPSIKDQNVLLSSTLPEDVGGAKADDGMAMDDPSAIVSPLDDEGEAMMMTEAEEEVVGEEEDGEEEEDEEDELIDGIVEEIVEEDREDENEEEGIVGEDGEENDEDGLERDEIGLSGDQRGEVGEEGGEEGEEGDEREEEDGEVEGEEEGGEEADEHGEEEEEEDGEEDTARIGLAEEGHGNDEDKLAIEEEGGSEGQERLADEETEEEDDGEDEDE